jgi:hypothetical protein
VVGRIVVELPGITVEPTGIVLSEPTGAVVVVVEAAA